MLGFASLEISKTFNCFSPLSLSISTKTEFNKLFFLFVSFSCISCSIFPHSSSINTFFSILFSSPSYKIVFTTSNSYISFSFFLLVFSPFSSKYFLFLIEVTILCWGLKSLIFFVNWEEALFLFFFSPYLETDLFLNNWKFLS